MKKWEYRFEKIDKNERDVLTSLGLEGWEICGVFKDRAGWETYVLKKELDSDGHRV